MRILILTDGSVLAGKTAEELIDRWNGLFMNQVIEPDKFRQAIADRARLWSGTEISIDGTADDFLNECERARLVTFLNERALRTLVEMTVSNLKG